MDHAAFLRGLMRQSSGQEKKKVTATVNIGKQGKVNTINLEK